MRWRIDKNRRDDRGASAVEFALVVIPLLMIIAGIVNFGFVFAQQLALDNAIRAGARAGVVDTGRDPATVATTEWNSAAIARSLTGTMNVTFPGARSTCEGAPFGQSLAVRGTVNTRFLIPWPLPGSMVPRNVNLSSQAEFQCEFE